MKNAEKGVNFYLTMDCIRMEELIFGKLRKLAKLALQAWFLEFFHIFNLMMKG